MNKLPLLCVLLAVGASVAWCQYSPGTVTTTATVVAVPDAAAALAPAQVCAIPAGSIYQPCPAVVTETPFGPELLVLGTQETFALPALPVRDVTWRDVPFAYQSQFEVGNPLFYTRPNASILRHGNPNYPYIQVGQRVNVAGTIERYTAVIGGLAPNDRTILQAVAQQYRNLNINQVCAMGYQQVTVPADQGLVFLNPALLDNVLEPMRPEAFVFDRQGRLVGAQYYIVTPAPVVAFGQPTRSSALVAGGQQLNVWLFRTNAYGLFAERHPDLAR